MKHEITVSIGTMTLTIKTDSEEIEVNGVSVKFKTNPPKSSTNMVRVSGWRSDNKIAAIKAIRDTTFMSLKEAKEAIERIQPDCGGERYTFIQLNSVVWAARLIEKLTVLEFEAVLV